MEEKQQEQREKMQQVFMFHRDAINKATLLDLMPFSSF